MKAKIKKTGEIIEVENLYDDGTALVGDMLYKVSELDFDSVIDWETRRYEIAKAMLPVIYLDDGQAERADDSDVGFEYKSDRHCAKEAVDFADALIEELKKRKQYE